MDVGTAVFFLYVSFRAEVFTCLEVSLYKIHIVCIFQHLKQLCRNSWLQEFLLEIFRVTLPLGVCAEGRLCLHIFIFLCTLCIQRPSVSLPSCSLCLDRMSFQPLVQSSRLISRLCLLYVSWLSLSSSFLNSSNPA